LRHGRALSRPLTSLFSKVRIPATSAGMTAVEKATYPIGLVQLVTKRPAALRAFSYWRDSPVDDTVLYRPSRFWVLTQIVGDERAAGDRLAVFGADHCQRSLHETRGDTFAAQRRW